MRSDKVANGKDRLPLTPDDGLHLRHRVETPGQQIAGRLPEEPGRRTQGQWRRGKFAGRRMTNDRRRRKGTPPSDSDRAGNSGRRASVLWAKPGIVEEANGDVHSTTRRRKRRRHAKRVPLRNWGDPIRSDRTVLSVSGGIRRNAESQRQAGAGVGDGHSSGHGEGQHNPVERRAISLGTLLTDRGDLA